MTKARKDLQKTAYDTDMKGVRSFIRGILESEEYRKNLKRRAMAGVLHNNMEQMLWHYLYGKPKENVPVEGHEVDYSSLSETELIGEVKRLEQELIAAVAEAEVAKDYEKAKKIAGETLN